jgi:hypothetical protein
MVTYYLLQMLALRGYNNIEVVEKRRGFPDAGAPSQDAGEVAL